MGLLWGPTASPSMSCLPWPSLSTCSPHHGTGAAAMWAPVLDKALLVLDAGQDPKRHRWNHVLGLPWSQQHHHLFRMEAVLRSHLCLYGICGFFMFLQSQDKQLLCIASTAQSGCRHKVHTCISHFFELIEIFPLQTCNDSFPIDLQPHLKPRVSRMK